MDVERGTIGPLPCFATGQGPPALFIAGLSPDTGVSSPGAALLNKPLVAPFVKTRRVRFVNRRAGLPHGMTMVELAAEHAAAIRALDAGPVVVAGISTGGSIAQQLAADHPELVERLVLLSTACRLGPEGKRLQRRVAARVRAGADRKAFAVLGAGLVPPGKGRTLAGVVAWLAGPRLAHGCDLGDMATTIEAEDAFDLAACERPIRAPTLILGGHDDRFYRPDLFEETAALIPGSRLRVFAGRGHMTVTSHPEFRTEIEAFLAG